MRRTAWVLAFFLTASCSIFGSPDPEPATAAIAELRRIDARLAAREEAVVSKISDATAAATIRAGFAADHAAIARLHDALLGWVDAVGEIDWRKLYEDIRKLPGEGQ